MHITPEEANFLLYCLDHYCDTDSRGHVKHTGYCDGYTVKQVQELRDRLMAIHEHPDELVVEDEGSDFYTRKTLFDPQCGEDED